MKKRFLALVLAVLMTAALCACGGGKSPTAQPTDIPNGSAGEKALGGEITVVRRRQEPERSFSTSMKGF